MKLRQTLNPVSNNAEPWVTARHSLILKDRFADCSTQLLSDASLHRIIECA